METIRVTWKGIAPLMVHNGALANPMGTYARAIKAITSKRKKTDEDHEELMRLEWHGSLYWDAEIGPYIPGEAIDATIRSGAKLSRRGRDVQRAVMCIDTKVPIMFDGPKQKGALTPEVTLKLWSDERFRDVRGVRVQQARTMRCRPIFPDWSLAFDLAFAPDVINESDLLAVMADAGRLEGLCEYRPRFGRFEMTSSPATKAA
jgi:hypothetical protein